MAKAKSVKNIRLNKFIADCGIASRRKADQMIEEGRVTVNGKKVYELGQKVSSDDTILVDKKPIRLEVQHHYIMFYKPRDVVTSMSEPEGRPCVGDFFEDYPARLFPVGRLDWDSEGMLLMTNDGDFSQNISHPSKDIPKTYHVKVDGKVPTDKIQKLLNGVSIQGGGRVKAKSIRKLRKGAGKKDWLEVIITEGKNRQIRKMFLKIGFDVEKLQRTAIGKLDIGKLERGKFKALTQRQIDKIFESDDVVKKKKKVASTSIKRQMATESSQSTQKKKKKKKSVRKTKASFSKATSTKKKAKKKKKLGFMRN